MKQTENKIINKKHGFTMIENCILRNPKISRNARLMYGILLSYAFGTDTCFPGHKRLAIEMGIAETHVRYALRELRGWGLISWTSGKFEKLDAYGNNYIKTNTYTIEKIPAYIKREFEKDQKDMVTEIRNAALYGEPTKEENEKKRAYLKDIQNRMEIKGRSYTKKGEIEAE